MSILLNFIKNLHKKSIKTQELKKNRFGGQIDPPLGGLRYNKTLCGLRVNAFLVQIFVNIW